jgi:Holliday junction resolvase RusA-like endonuclease
MSIIIELAGEPRGKGRPRFTANGIAYTPPKTRAHEAALRFAAQAEMNGRPPVEGPIRVKVCATFQVPASWPKKKRAAALAGHLHHTTRPDWDNVAKMLDALAQVVWRDDRQIVSAIVTKKYGERPALRIEVEASHD